MEKVMQLKVLISQEEKGFPDAQGFDLLFQTSVLGEDETFTSLKLPPGESISLDIVFREGQGVHRPNLRQLAKQSASGSAISDEARTAGGLTLDGIRSYLSYGATWQNVGGTLFFYTMVGATKSYYYLITYHNVYIVAVVDSLRLLCNHLMAYRLRLLKSATPTCTR
jgi:hypothetical protein